MINESPQADNGQVTPRNRAIAIAVLAVGVVWYLISPFVVLLQIQNAVKTDNVDAISSLVDFPQVRDTLKDSLRAAMAKSMGDYIKKARNDPNPYAAAGAGLGMLIAGPMIDSAVASYITPQGIVNALSSGRAPNLSSSSIAPTTPPDAGSSSPSNMPMIDFHYVSFDSFAVNVGAPDGAHIETRLCRVNLFGWRLCSLTVANLIPAQGGQ